MTGFLVRRIGQAVVVVIGVIIITFVIIHLEPGSPARAALGTKATAVAIAHFDKVNGLNNPLPQQFLAYLNRLVHGNLGYSFTLSQTVGQLIAERLPKDLILVGISSVISVIVAIPLGIYQAVRRNRIGDYTATGLAYIFYSMPIFFLSLLLIAGFAIQFHVLPPEAPQFTNALSILAHPRGLILPVAALALVTISSYSQYLRGSAIENLAQDYIRTARAKGLSERAVLFRHLLRNTMIPIVTLLGLTLPVVVGGALIVEAVFNYPGMGLLFFQAALQQDYPILLGFTLFIGVATVVGNLLADIVYGVLDPRVRLE